MSNIGALLPKINLDGIKKDDDMTPVGKLGLSFEDQNANQVFDVGEVAVFVDKDGVEDRFVLQDMKDGVLFLNRAVDCPEEENPDVELSGNIYAYAPEHGFVFKNSYQGKSVLVRSGDRPFDQSGYSILLLQSSQVLSDELVSKIPNLDLAKSDLTVEDGAFTSQMREAFNHVSFLKKLGFKNIEELYAKYEIVSEGEVIFGDYERNSLGYAFFMAQESTSAVTYDHNGAGKPAIVFDRDFLSEIFAFGKPSSQKLNDLRSILYHEAVHAQQKNMQGGIVDPSRLEDNRLRAWFEAIGQNEFMVGREIFLLWNNNPFFQSYYNAYFTNYTQKDPHASASAVWINSIVESEAYVKQLEDMSKTGFDKFSPEFVAHIVQNSAYYFDLSFSLLRMDGGSEYLNQIFVPVLKNPDLQKRLLNQAEDLDAEKSAPHFVPRLQAFLKNQDLPL